MILALLLAAQAPHEETSRSDVASHGADSRQAPAPPIDEEAHYPGTCRDLPDDPERRSTMPHSWRLNSANALEIAGLPTWREEDGREHGCRVGYHADGTEMLTVPGYFKRLGMNCFPAGIVSIE